MCLFGLLTIGLLCWSCSGVDKEAVLEGKIENYFSAWNGQNFDHPHFSEFKRDTSYTWHGTKKGKEIRSVFNPNSGWKQWDKAWNGAYTYRILKIEVASMKVTGEFTETTDFLKIIGMPEGLAATVTFWFDDTNKVEETLYAWNSDNKNMHQLLKPIVTWAKEHDSVTIQKIYLQDGFVPNTENAEVWKRLIERYETAINRVPNE